MTAVVAEIDVDVATGPGGRPHLAPHIRTRPELRPDDLPLWRPGPRTD